MAIALDPLLGLAQSLAADAAALLAERLDEPRSEVRTKSSPTDMVSEVDHASERLIVDGIRRARPDDGILSEEGASAEGSTGLRWVIDPLDGTTDFLYGHPGFAVSIAVEREGRTVVGVVHDPVHEEVFTAIRGGGAARNGASIAPSGATELASALVATGFAYEPERRRAQARALTEILPRVRDIRRMGAAAVDLCSVACGRVDAYFERGLNHWDLAAGALIAEEAGALVARLEPNPAAPDGIVAATPAVLEPLRALLAEAGA
ncbi:MAG: inositol monophosphatase [Solirubrobacterales bacterium]|nr:inositol monophosphatase [Solirubrobacterales bacterium]